MSLDPDIEEDEDTCIVRIAPKPIKIKIKPLAPPAANSPATGTVLPPPTADLPPSLPSSPYMHPKKKMVHMDYLSNNDIHAGGSGNTSRLTGTTTAAGSDSIALRGERKAVLEGPSTPLPKGREVNLASSGDEKQTAVPTQTPYRVRRDSGQERSSSVSSSSTGRPVRERNGFGGGVAAGARKGGDVRTKCDVCLGEGTNANLVR